MIHLEISENTFLIYSKFVILFSNIQFTQVFKDTSAVGNKEYLYCSCVVMVKWNHKGVLGMKMNINNRVKARKQKMLALSICWNQRLTQLPNNLPFKMETKLPPFSSSSEADCG